MIHATARAFILRRNAYRDNGLLMDVYTQEEGRVSVIARFSKRQGTRLKGMLEPFRLLEVQCSGRGEVLTLQQAEEKRRYLLKQGALLQATYINELLLRAFQPHQPTPELFLRYQQTLHALQTGADMRTLMLFELDILATCAYELNLWEEDASGQALDARQHYRFQPERGLCVDNSRDDVAPGAGHTLALPLSKEPLDAPVSGELLIALRTPEQMLLPHWQELRQLLDRLFRLLLKGKTLYARQLLSE